MSRRMFQDDRMPWSLFLPMTMAVVIGVLIADGVRYAITEVFAARAVTDATRIPASTSTPTAPVIATPQATTASEPTQAFTLDDPAATATSPASAPAAPSASTDAPMAMPSPSPASADGTTAVSPSAMADAAPAATPSSSDIERLPGTVGARRDKQPRACINGTVAVRDRNGWQQELSADRPVRCEQTGP